MELPSAFDKYPKAISELNKDEYEEWVIESEVEKINEYFEANE